MPRAEVRCVAGNDVLATRNNVDSKHWHIVSGSVSGNGACPGLTPLSARNCTFSLPLLTGAKAPTEMGHTLFAAVVD